MPPLLTACLLVALSALALGSHDPLATSAQKLRGWPASNYLLLGQSPEARSGFPTVALNGAIYMFGGATAMGKRTRSVAESPRPLSARSSAPRVRL